jgi:integrase
MSKEQIDSIVHNYLDEELHAVEERLATDAWKLNGPEWRDTAQHLLIERIDEITDCLAYNLLKPVLPEAQRLLPGGEADAIAILARRILEAKLQVTQAELGALNGQPLPRSGSPGARIGPPAGASPGQPMGAPGPLLSVMVSDYVAFKGAGGKWTAKTRSQLMNLFRIQVALIEDKPARAVTKEDMRRLYRVLPQLPTHSTKRYPGMSAQEAIAAADADGNDERLSPKSQNDYFTHIKSLWKWAVENDYVDNSPAVVLKDVAETAAWEQRLAFTDEQIAAYFAALDRLGHVAMQWVPRLMLFGGLRLEEAAKLTPADVRVVDDVTVLDINRRVGRLKTANADRLIPVHSALLEPLMSYVRDRAGSSVGAAGNLWGLQASKQGIFSTALSKRLNAVLDQVCPEDGRLVPYSLRHTFATRLKHADVLDTVLDELLGHKVEKLSVGRYEKRYEVGKLQAAVERLSLPCAATVTAPGGS